MSDLSSFINIGANTASFVGAVTSNAIVSTTGTITAAAFATDGVGGDITGANVISATTFTATGNVSAANFVTTGPSGNISGANVISANTFGLLHGGKITEVVSPVAGNYAIALSALGTVSNDQQ